MEILKKKSFKVHIICWLIFIAYEILVSYSFNRKFANFFDYAGHYSLNIGLFYFNAHVTFAKYFKTKKGSLIVFFFLLLLELLVYLELKYFLYLGLLHFNIYTDSQILSSYKFLTQSIWRYIYFIGLSTGYWFFISTLKHWKEVSEFEKFKFLSLVKTEELNKKVLESENSFLKAQINPHFLFNVLGFMHNLVRKQSPVAAETVALLSDMMRYALDKPQLDGKTYLDNEIEHIQNYIQINEYRFGRKLNLDFKCEGDTEGAKIVPLLLITIVENIFKYGDLTDQEFPAKIILKLKENLLTFLISNKKLDRPNGISNGIGMSNVIKRLEQHYKYKHEVRINNSDQQYELTLLIIL